jgi:hypothetical protein
MVGNKRTPPVTSYVMRDLRCRKLGPIWAGTTVARAGTGLGPARIASRLNLSPRLDSSLAPTAGTVMLCPLIF